MLTPLAATRTLGPLAVGGPAGGASSLLTGLVGYWKLDEASGDRADSGPGGLTLSITGTGGTIGARAGKLSNAADFTGGVDGKSLRNASGLGLSAAASLSYWVYMDVSSNYRFLGEWFATNKWLAGNNAATVLFFIGATAYGYKAALLPTGAWAHYCWIYDGAGVGNAGKLKLYVAGSPITLDYSGTIPATIPAGAAAFDALTAYPSYGIDGALDEVGVWSRAITSDEVTTLYNGGAGKTHPFA